MKRRTLLKQTAAALGAGALSPFDRLLAADTAAPRRGATKFLFVVEGNGLPQRQIQPPSVPYIPLGERQTRHRFPIDDLPKSLEPIAEWQDQMLIVQGITGRVCGGGHSNDHGTLGSYNARDGKLIAGPTIDYLIGAQSSDRIFENVVLGINGNNKDVIFNLSASEKDKPIATICNPRAAYNRLFGALGNRDEVAKDKAMIAYLKRDIARTEIHLGRPDAKLQKYAAAFDAIDARNERIGRMKLERVPELTEKYDSIDHVEMLDAHFEMAGAALAGDLTDVATVAVGVGYEHFQIAMNSLEGVQEPRHNLGHQNMKGKDPAIPQASHDEAALVRRYVFQLIARTMKEVDNLVVVYTSDAAEKHHSSGVEWPHVLMTNHPNPALKLDRQFLYYPEDGTEDQRTLNAFHNTLLRTVGIELESFGQLANNVTQKAQVGILPELLA